MIALAIKKKKSSNLLRMTNRFMLKFFSMRVLIGFIVFIPAMVLAGLGGMLFFVNEILGILSIFLFIILFFGYLIFMSLKLFFATPIMFVEEQGPLRSIKQSFQMTKGHLKQVLIILFMIVGITIFINSFVGQPLYNTYLSLFFESNLVKVAINLVLVLFFLMLESFVFTFEYLFLFLSYVDFKRLKKGGKK
jgi:membrane-anchored glycerophosphoryl diester phosphodiesterase (GDPDase)